jgi:poly(A) polymerase Pap1
MAIQYLGISSPLSTQTSTPMDIKLTKELEETLSSFGMYDSPERQNAR